jgi:deazaflavin-dependent oxidoreductase (nitroreductase family)
MTSGLHNWNDSIIKEFRENNGTVTQNGFGRRLVLVHHIGAKSGQERVSPVAAIRPDDDTWLIAASKAGAPDNPAWYHNLRANPDVKIETPDDGEVSVHAEVLEGADRDDAWKRFIKLSPAFAQYQEKTSRIIPIIALRRV